MSHSVPGLVRSRVLIGLASLLFLVAFPALGDSVSTEIVIAGRVVGPEGTPVEGGAVELIPLLNSLERGKRQLAGHLRPEPVARENIRPDGRFQIKAPGPGLWIAEVKVPGYRVMEHWFQPLLEAVALPQLTLEEVAELVVTVRDEGGEPIEDASVTIERERSRWAGRQGAWRPKFLFRRTDAQGRVHLHPIAGEKVQVTAWSRDHSPEGGEAAAGERLEIRLSAGEARTLEVHTPGGDPAPGVLVVVGDGWTAGLTDEAGRFTVAGPPDKPLAVGLYTDTVWDKGFWLPPRKRDAEGTLLEEPPTVFTLPVIRRLQGRVVDARDRAPIPQAFVWVRQAQEFSTWTTAGGLYTLTLPETLEAAGLRAAAAGYQGGAGRVQQGAELPTIVLEPAVALRGHVVDEQGAALAGIEVQGHPDAGMNRRMRGQGVQTAWTAEDGGFRLSGLAPTTRYKVTAQEPGYATTGEAIVTPAPGERGELVEIVLPVGRRVLGTVLTVDDLPIAGATVTLHRPLGGDLRSAFFQRFRGRQEAPATATTDGEGRFEVRDLGPGRYDLEVQAEGFAATTIRGVEIPAGGGQSELGTVILEPGVSLAGQVVDEDGAPLEGASVGASPARGMGLPFPLGGRAVEGVETDAEGRFLLQDLKAGESIDLGVGLEGYLGRSLPGVAVPREAPLEIVLETAAQIAGQVVNEKDEPVPNAVVLLSQQGSAFRGGQQHERTGEDGTFLFGTVEPGSYTLMARQRGALPSEERTLAVTKGQAVSAVTLVLRRGATVEGQVFSNDGNPVHGARVGSVQSSSMNPMNPMASLFVSAETDGDGHYRLEGVPPGSLSLEANHPGHSRAVRDLEVRPGTNRLDFTLESGTEVAGRVVTALGEPIAGAAVQLMGMSGRFGGPEAVTGGDGVFRIPSVPSGSYRAVARKDSLTTAGEGMKVEVQGEPVTGLELVLGAGATITGQVTGLDFEALSTLQIRASGGGRDMVLGEVDYEGSYRLGPVSPGPWLVQAGVGGTGEQVMERVTVEEGATAVTLDLDFGTGHVLTGRVLQGGEPLVGVRVQVVGLSAGKSALATTTFEGTFRLTGLATDDYHLSVQNWRTGLQHTEKLSLSADQEIDVEIGGAPLRGVVRSGVDGGPVSQAQVRLVLEGGDAVGRVIAPTTATGSDGTFRFEAIAEGIWRVRVTKEGYAFAEQTVTVAGTPGEEIEITLQPTQGLEVQVLLPDGRPADYAAVVLLDEGGNTVASGQYRTREGGLIHLDTAPPGRWWLQASGDNLGAVRQRVEVPGPRVEVRLSASGWLDLRIPALEGSALPATVAIRGSDGAPYVAVSGFGFGQTQQFLYRGHLERLPLPAGNWTLTVTAGDGRRWEGVARVTAGETVELVLE
jgi:protocatechuate 3,4-dioxygenase beta subunit